MSACLDEVYERDDGVGWEEDEGGVCQVPLHLFQGCIKFLIPPGPWRAVYQICCGRTSSCEEGGEYNGCVKKIHEKRESNIIFPIILRLLVRISNGKEGKGTEIFQKKMQNLKKWRWGRISSSGKLYTALPPPGYSSPAPPASRCSPPHPQYRYKRGSIA